MSLTILLASPGVGLRSVEERLNQRPSTIVRDVEDRLLADPTIWQSDRFYFTQTRNMRAVLRHFTRSEVIERWKMALKDCLSDLEESKADHKVLAFHPSLFAPRRSEHYSTIATAISDHRIREADRVVMLIDDIYDMWSNLSQDSNDLFHQDAWLRRRLEAQDLDAAVHYTHKTQSLVLKDAGVIAEGESKRKEETFRRLIDASEFNQLVLESSSSILSQLLAWRHLDMVEAESLAASIQAKMTVFGVKHPLEALSRLLEEPDTITSYLSHPISRPRRTFLDGVKKTRKGDWPSVVSDSNDLSRRFADYGVVLVCPTAIDEFRLEQPAKSSDRSANLLERALVLTERWPPLVDGRWSLNGAKRASDRLVQTSLTAANTPAAFEATLARSLESLIYAEVPFRDHFLVTHTDALLVYRPLYETGVFSDGVKNEITHWEAFWRGNDSTRKALFIHSPSDLQVICARIGQEVQYGRSRFYATAKQVLERRQIPKGIVEAILSGQHVRSEMLDSEFLEEGSSIESLTEAVYDEAGKIELFTELTGLSADLYGVRSIAISSLRGEAPSSQEMKLLASFLTSSQTDEALDGSLEEAIYSDIERHLGCSISEWARSAVKN